MTNLGIPFFFFLSFLVLLFSISFIYVHESGILVPFFIVILICYGICHK